MNDEEKRDFNTGAMLLAECGSKIAAVDCAAFAMMNFSPGEVDDQWRDKITDAMQKFMLFGWTAFHAFGGLHTDWDLATTNIMCRLKDELPKKSPKEPVPSVQEPPVPKQPVAEKPVRKSKAKKKGANQ